MGLGDFVPDSWEDAAEGAWEGLGEGVDRAGDFGTSSMGGSRTAGTTMASARSHPLKGELG